MKKNRFLFVGIFASMLLMTACTEEGLDSNDIDITGTIDPDDALVLAQTLDLPDGFYDYESATILPDHLDNNNIRREDNTPNNNRVTNEGATLGRVLFYDKKLSANNTIACASCHLQENSFADPSPFSAGFEGGLTGRNSMGLANANFYRNGNFFWDERANTLEDQVLLPIQDHIEMGMTLEELVPKLQAEAYYEVLFRQAFDNETVTTDRISLALSQFVRSMTSFNSKYDEGLAQGGGNNGGPGGGNIAGFTNQEDLGRRLFGQEGCLACHSTDLFVGDEARNNGLDATITDNGLGNVTGNNNDNGKFKVPSLRNIELTAPYMHDGRFETLEEVVEHYNSGIQDNPTLDNRLQRGNQPERLNLSNNEKAALVAFLKTLTDNNFITDPRYANPFKE